MTDYTVVQELFVVMVFIFALLVREALRLGRTAIETHSENVIPVVIGVVCLNNLSNFFTVQRNNPFELLNSGLSISNILSVVSSLAVVTCSGYLLATRRTLLHNMFRGPSFWLVSLFTLYAASTLWSIFPTGTGFRSVEIIAYYIIALYIFTGKDPVRTLYWTMLVEITIAALQYVPEGIDSLRSGRTFGFFVSNQYALYAAVFLFLHWQLYPARILGYVYGIFLFAGFGSTASSVAFLAGILTYIVVRDPRSIIYALRFPVMGVILMLCLLPLFRPDYFGEIFYFISPLVQKKPEDFFTATGRLIIWKVYFENLVDVPFGIGFWSERAFLSRFINFWWVPPNAHNGFISAWIAAGLPAVLCLCVIYGSIIQYLRTQNFLIRRICHPLLIMLFINSWTYPGIGGYFTLWYFVLAAIVMLSISKDITDETSPKPGGQRMEIAAI